MTYSDFPKTKRQPNNDIGCAVVLLLPLILLLATNRLFPAIETFMMSFTDSNLLSEPEFVGFENYSRLFTDERFWNTVQYTFYIIIERVFVISIVPLLIGWLIGQQGKIGRILNRLVLGVLAAFISPMALIILWRMFASPVWGREASPLSRELLEMLMVNTPQNAIMITLMLDALITMAITVVVGSIVYIAVLRGRETHSRFAMKVGITVWVGGLLYAVVSGLNAFLIPFVLTRGGPATSTTSIYLYAYEQGFRAMRLGLSSTQAVLLMIPAILAVVIGWLLLTMYRLRIVSLADDADSPHSSSLSIISLPVIILLFLPIVGLIAWGYTLSQQGEGASAVSWANTFPNILIPILTIWFIQIPISYMGGAGLALMRPASRIVSNILFLIMLIVAFLPDETLVFQWFMDARDAELINTSFGQYMPWVTGGVSFLVFKLFFDGMYAKIQSAREHGQTTGSVLGNAIVTSLPLVLVVGLGLTFVSIQSLLWNLLVAYSPETFAPTVRLWSAFGSMGSGMEGIAATAVQFVQMFFLPFALAFGLLSGFGLEKYALVGGDGDSGEPTAFADLLGNRDDAGMGNFSTDDEDSFLYE